MFANLNLNDKWKHLQFRDSNKRKTLRAERVISKTRKLFPSEKKLAQVFRLRSPLIRGTMPANHACFAFKWFSKVTHPDPIINFLSRNWRC
ncbi:MAG: hypothetical protein M1326_03490 [Cyanobacteria bacterium]|nr:hypothetical protein [Cyanobacteriota bacterium]